MKKLLTTVALAGAIITGAQAQLTTNTITQWTFEDTNNTTAPATAVGSGTASLLGGTTATFATGSGGAGTFGWNTTTYAAQSTGSGTRGVQFNVSTLTFSNINISFQHRASGTASRWAQLDYTLDGSTWTTNFWNNSGGLSPHDTFYNFSVDLSSVAGANNNTNFGFRIVSIFSPLAFDQNSTNAPFAADTAYMRANAGAVYEPNVSAATGDYATGGTWRFDNVLVTEVVPEPSTYALLASAGVGLAAYRFRRRARR